MSADARGRSAYDVALARVMSDNGKWRSYVLKVRRILVNSWLCPLLVCEQNKVDWFLYNRNHRHERVKRNSDLPRGVYQQVNPETHSEPTRTSKMELCTKIFNGVQTSIIFTKNSSLDGFWMRLCNHFIQVTWHFPPKKLWRSLGWRYNPYGGITNGREKKRT